MRFCLNFYSLIPLGNFSFLKLLLVFMVIISELAIANELIRFPEAQFEYIGVLDQGNSTTILDLGRRQALRTPLQNHDFKRNAHLLYQYAVSYPILKAYRVPAPKIYEVGGLNHQTETVDYIRLERVPVVTSLDQWLIKYETAATSERQLAALMVFAKRLSAFSVLGDFAPRQVIWTGHRWILLDWFGGHRLATSNSSSPFMTWLLQDYDFGSRTNKLIVRLDRASRLARSDCEIVLPAQLTSMDGFGFIAPEKDSSHSP